MTLAEKRTLGPYLRRTIDGHREDAKSKRDRARAMEFEAGCLRREADEHDRRAAELLRGTDGETAKHGPFSAAEAEELYNRIDGEIGGEK